MAELKRTLGFWMTSAFVFLNLVNTGIFFGVQIGVAVAGIDSIFAWVAFAVMSIYTGMCFAELTTMFPSAGGVYEFAKQAYGRFVSFEIGWIIWMINNIATALLTIAAMEYLLPIEFVRIGTLVLSGGHVKLVLAIAIILVLNYIAYHGADESARLMVLLAIFTFALAMIVLVPGLFAIQMSEFAGFSLSWPLILLAAFMISETFFGWESVSFMAEEIKQPEKIIPKAIISTTTFVAVMSVGVAVVTIGVLGVPALAEGTYSKPLVAVLEELGLVPWLIFVANLGIVVTFLGNAAGGIIANPRLLMALSRDKLFIEQFEDIHPRYQTPYRGIIIQTIASLLIVLLAAGAFERLLQLMVAPSIILYAAIIFLVPYFRWTRSKQERPYVTPLGNVLPLFLVGVYIALLIFWAVADPSAGMQLRLLGSFLIFSIPIYLLLTYFYNPDVLIGTLNRFAFLNLWFENFLLPRELRREILTLFPDAQDRHFLEFGAGVGTMTKHLAEHVGPQGRVTALEVSEANVRILEKRMKRLGHKHVRALHDPHMVNRVHPQVERVDMVVSIGNLSYIQDLKKVLGELGDILPARGKICFVEYVDLFWFLPNNPKWIKDPDAVREKFREAGYSVSMKVKRGLFWSYLYIYGVKEKKDVPYV